MTVLLRLLIRCVRRANLSEEAQALYFGQLALMLVIAADLLVVADKVLVSDRGAE